MLRQAVSGIVLFFVSVSVASGATYYVRTDGNNANTGTANATAGAWLTISYAVGHVAAGDTVRVQPGTYVERAAPSVNGTSGNTVTLVADGTVTTCGLTFSSKSYIRVIGFTLDPSTSGCSSGTAVNGTGQNTGLEFWNVTVQNNSANKAYSFDIGLNSTNRCDKCIWVGGSVKNIGGSVSLVAMLTSGDDDFVGYLNFSNICYVGIGPTGARGRFVNNNFSGLTNCGGGAHPDNFYIATNATEGWTNNLVESVFNIGTPTLANNKFHHQENQNTPVWADNIYRFNVSYNLGGGVMSLYNSGGANLRTRDYNNTWVQPERAQSTNGCQTIGSGSTTTLYDYNDLFYQCWSPGVRTNIAVWGFGSGTSSSANLFADYNLAFDPAGTDTFSMPWTGQAHKQTNVDPKFNNFASQDFTLQSTSGARGVGGPLTTATSCSGTTVNVATNGGAFFVPDDSSNLSQYGGKLVPGDTITVGSTPHTIVSITGDAITLDTAATCLNGDPVYFGSSSIVDVGGYPYKAGGFALSAGYSISGGTATITPNDPSLVRFAVCYSDNVPYAVVNRAPYTCAVPTGTFSARVYPRYASQTLSVAAVFGNGPPAAPTGVTIIR